ncbi:hypothetical protein COOONC_15142 [Cooperia oncophora]
MFRSFVSLTLRSGRYLLSPYTAKPRTHCTASSFPADPSQARLSIQYTCGVCGTRQVSQCLSKFIYNLMTLMKRQRMESDVVGARLLKERPRVNNQTVNREYLESLPENTFGKRYAK